MRQILFWAIYLTGIHRIFYYLNRQKLTILLYHGIDVKRDMGIYNYRKKFITPHNFKKQIQYIKRNYTLLDLDEAIGHLKNKSLPKNPIVITFDDGYRNNYSHAYPIIKNSEVPATLFLTTNFIDKKSPIWVDRIEYTLNKSPLLDQKTNKEKEKMDVSFREKMKKVSEENKNMELEEMEQKYKKVLTNFEDDRFIYAPLSWEEIIEMQKNKVKFGAHTKNHPILTNIPTEKMEEEIRESKDLVEKKIGVVSKVFCYPNGQENDFNQKTVEIVKKIGFESALTTIPGFNDYNSDLFSLKRLSMDNTDNFANFILTLSGIKEFIRKLISYANRSKPFQSSQ
jgi:peptidoglycan/xylan/chitin deacetylase (PgdA/CDA1 family)